MSAANSHTRLHNKVKLCPDEILWLESPEVEYQVFRKLADLKVKSSSGKSVFAEPNMLLNQGQTSPYGLVLYRGRLKVEDKRDTLRLVTAIEWLNRHEILVMGQEVLVRDNHFKASCWVRRLYVTSSYARKEPDLHYLIKWDHIRSPYKRWVDVDIPTTIRLTVNGKRIAISDETLKAIKEAL